MLKAIAKATLGYFDLLLVRKNAQNSLLAERDRLIGERDDLNRICSSIPWARYWIALQDEREFLAPFLAHSKSQFGQDLFALHETRDIPGRKFFVDFGASDGMSLSNSWLLETKLGWNGIVAEPARVWHETLKANRSCSVDTRCV